MIDLPCGATIRLPVYDFTSDRTRAGPASFLKDFTGYLQADVDSGYDEIYLDRESSIVEVPCWTHCRRYWHKARENDAERSRHVLAVISRLYEIERATADQSAEVRQSMRAEHAVPLLDDLESWLEAQSFLPKSLIGKAATYTRNQWQALRRYVEDGDLSIDNNFAERAMRPIAIGRKNGLFVGSPAAGDRAALLISLIASCKNNEVEPWAWLRDIVTRLASKPTGDELAQLLPDHWLTANPTYRWTIATRRRNERQAKKLNLLFTVRLRFVRHGLSSCPTIGPGLPADLLPTKDTKSTKESENETLDAIFQFCHVEVH